MNDLLRFPSAVPRNPRIEALSELIAASYHDIRQRLAQPDFP